MNEFKQKIFKLENFYRKKKRMPSFKELADLLRLKSKNSAYRWAEKLKEAEIIERDGQGKILPGRLFNQVSVLGTVEAGFPSPAEEELVDTMSLDEYLIENKEATFLLKVSGDSMIEAGIMPGDLALVEKGRTAKDGDIVIAQVDGSWTMKYLIKKGKQVYLKPANKKYSPIYPKEELNIAAVVKSVIRKY
ncbi:MAG: transcriptional repressor LexA [Candidatus Moranbacteria bacterium]|nr:transcriptional repressor LexA [Candidatus Moranbacteria bacterium]